MLYYSSEIESLKLNFTTDVAGHMYVEMIQIMARKKSLKGAYRKIREQGKRLRQNLAEALAKKTYWWGSIQG